MPHEVIMPALGVAQDTGLIIAWLKQSGDAVKTGDALMEIETDKAVMEVEAQADGYLANITAVAGDHVPVGQVVGLITESAEELELTVPENACPVTETVSLPDAFTDELPKGNQIIMPALGMAQDTGRIVAWHKQPGDAVLATDKLLDVETDKSVMEVEAGHDGYLAAILAEAQQDVPVGSTIAIISPSRPDKPSSGKPLDAALQVSHGPAEVRETPQTSATAEAEERHVQSLDSTDVTEQLCSMDKRILASPKARRLAIEQGLDLEELARQGVPQPFHVSDLEALASLRKTAVIQDQVTRDSRQVQYGLSVLRVEASVPAQADIDFIGWIETHKNISVPPRMNWLRYASAALRQASGRHSGQLIVELRQLCEFDGCYADADLSRLSMPVTKSADQTPDLVLRDFSNTPLTAVTTTAQPAPVLTVRHAQENYTISLDYRTDQLDENVAIAFLTDFSRRLAEPLRHLL